jgi:hypothetical protein
MRLVTGLFAASALAFLMAAADTKFRPPDSMTKMVVRLMGPGIKPKSFPALPKTIYRAGPHYARIEDPPDARQQIQKLTIIAEPDAYSVNLIDKKGTHAIDQGNAHDLHLPVVLPFDPKHQLGKLDRLEFGDEEDFFKEAGATPEAGPTINAKPTDALRLKIPTGSALLILRAGTHEPVFLSWQTKEGTYKYEYIEYKDMPFDPALFTKPAGIAYREIMPDKGSEVG